LAAATLRASCQDAVAPSPLQPDLALDALPAWEAWPGPAFRWRDACPLPPRPPRVPGAVVVTDADRRLSRALVEAGAPWALELASGTGCDRIAPVGSWDALRDVIAAGAVRVLAFTPACGSFSTAISPPCRSRSHPAGIPGLNPRLAASVDRDNERAKELCATLLRAAQCRVVVTIIHPRSSWFWQLPATQAATAHLHVLDMDLCRFGVPWKKPMRIMTSIASVWGPPMRCACLGPHRVLRGRCPRSGVSRSALAGAVPHGLARAVAAHGAAAADWAAAPASIPAFAEAACRW